MVINIKNKPVVLLKVISTLDRDWIGFLNLIEKYIFIRKLNLMERYTFIRKLKMKGEE